MEKKEKKIYFRAIVVVMVLIMAVLGCKDNGEEEGEEGKRLEEKKVKVTFYKNYNYEVEAEVMDVVEIKKGEKVKPIEVKGRGNGYEFLGWYEEKRSNKKFDFSKDIKEDIGIYARWGKMSSIESLEKILDILEEAKEMGLINKNRGLIYANENGDYIVFSDINLKYSVFHIQYLKNVDEYEIEVNNEYKFMFKDYIHVNLGWLRNEGEIKRYKEDYYGGILNINIINMIEPFFQNTEGGLGSDKIWGDRYYAPEYDHYFFDNYCSPDGKYSPSEWGELISEEFRERRMFNLSFEKCGVDSIIIGKGNFLDSGLYVLTDWHFMFY